MACAAEVTWKYILTNAKFCGGCALLSFELWSNREILKLGLTRKSALYESFLSIIREPEPERLAEMRFNIIRRLVPLLRCLAALTLLLNLCGYVTRGYLSPHGPDGLQQGPSVHGAIAYLVLTLISYFGTTPRNAGTLILVFSLLGTTSAHFLSWENFVASRAVRVLWRASLSAAYMDAKAMFPINLLHSIVSCIRCWQEQSLDPAVAIRFYVSEVLLFFYTIVICLATEALLKELLHNEAAAKAAKRATERLLSSYCDTIVRLGPGLRIAHATPKLLHLMCPTSLAEPHVLEGTVFVNHIATEADKERFAEFMSNSHAQALDGPAPALCVNLHHALGSRIFVELVHVNLSALGCAAEHLLGIRDIRTDGIPPDESHFQGSTPSSTHCPDREAVTVQRFPLQDVVFEKSVRQHRRPLRTSRSSRSSNSSGSSGSNVQWKKREIHGLNRIEFTFDFNTQLHRYSLCFEDKKDASPPIAKPDLEICLIGESRAPFIQWLHTNTNTLLWDSCGYLTYPGELFFRPPNAACASSNVVLCAESVSVRLLEGEDDASDDGEGDFELRLLGISQVVLHRLGAEHTRQQLKALIEENVAEINS